jgi:Domain of unknown function (DUF397)
VEIARVDDLIHLRDSKDKAGPVLTFDLISWNEFASAVRAGEFDQE